VLPIVEGDQDPIERPFTHFWAYGVIRRGWFSPYLMDTAGETPMRIIHDSYTPDGFWFHVYDEPPDWKQVQSDYEYVWAYDVPRFSGALAGIGDRIYSFDALEVLSRSEIKRRQHPQRIRPSGRTLILPRRSTTGPAHVFCATWVRSGSILIRAGTK